MKYELIPERTISWTPSPMPWMLLSTLAMSSAMSVSIYLARVWYADTTRFFFLNWNLLLAWIPLALALAMSYPSRQSRRPGITHLALFGLWLLFFPNAPYIVSDLMHLGVRDRVPLWYDTILLFSYAWNGLVLGFASLWLVQGLVTAWYGRIAGWCVVLATLFAGGFGIYLGRFQRWNSWDVLVDPIGIARELLFQFVTPFDHPRAVVVTLLFAGFLTMAYCTMHFLAAIQNPRNA
ncbi:MAG: DUF1361 domain-containing protein [Caldilineaceae bacterium]|nr:DUF1361 domain-containing protein [Caldilineaceae bacterium]